MESGVEYQEFQGRLAEAQICLEQGLDNFLLQEMLKGILADIGTCKLPDAQKKEIRTQAESIFKSVGGEMEECTCAAGDPAQLFNYGLALLDGRFWEEAIEQFRMAASLEHQTLKCWEYCGDCSSSMEKWEDAIHFYNIVYSDESISEEVRKRILVKISKCSHTQKKEDIQSAIQAKSNAPVKPAANKPEVITSSISSLDSSSISSILGQTVTSWTSSGGTPAVSETTRKYKITNFLHIGSSSLVVELEDSETGEKFAGQNLAGKFGECLSPEKLADWAERQEMVESRRLVKVYDLAHSNNHFFIVREHLPLSLNDFLATGEVMPLPHAIRFAYQILEALGDLHLQMGKDEKVQNQFHLDLRPSRVLIWKDKPHVKIYNGGLWKDIERAAPDKVNIKNLPLPYLSYRAPEQFRPYLSRKRPPVFTDIYLFGSLFYEILTGVPPFKASSYAEYEIQHCEQYPSPPKVWRPEISEVLNDLIMKCLQCDPMKRWRSATQISLQLEKSFPAEVARPKDDSYEKYLQKIKLI